MKHAGPDALDRLDDLLIAIRHIRGLRERRRGSFDSRLRVSVHFHQDSDRLYADLRVAGATSRLPVDTPSQQRQLLKQLTVAAATATTKAQRQQNHS